MKHDEKAVGRHRACWADIFFYFITFIALSAPVFAEGSVGGMEEPLWFLLLEPFGVALGIVAGVLLYRNYKRFGGVLGRSYNYILGMILFFIAAFVVRSLAKVGILPETILTEAIFEFLLYGGIVCVIISSFISARGFVKAFAKK